MHTVDQRGRLLDAHAVDRHVGLLRGGGKTNLGPVQLDARNQLGGRLHVAAGRDGVEHFAGQHLGLCDRLDVDDRRLTGDGDRLFKGADRQLGVEVQRETGRKLLGLDQNGREAGQRERNVVRPRPKVDDVVLPGAVTDGDAASLNQDRAGRLDRDTRQNAAGVVSDNAGNAGVTLSERAGGRKRQSRQQGDEGERTSHGVFPPQRNNCSWAHGAHT